MNRSKWINFFKFLCVGAGILIYLETAAYGDDEIWLICVDCYGSSAFYPQEAKKLFPDKKIKWIHVQTEESIQDNYRASFKATEGQYFETHKFNLDDPSHVEALLKIARARKISYAFGGMETGAMRADFLNNLFQQDGLKLIAKGNDPSTVALRREKAAAQSAVGEEYAIPTLLSGDLEKIAEFAGRQTSDKIVIKPNASSASQYMTVVSGTNADELSQRAAALQMHSFINPYAARQANYLRSMAVAGRREVVKTAAGILGKTDNYGHFIDEVIVEPFIEGTEYVANTIARNGRVTLVSIWRYEKVDLAGGLHSYLVDVPIDLHSPEARELREVLPKVHQRLGNLNGPGHTELFRVPFKDRSEARWYFIEHAARVGGAGMPMVDAQVWGTSQLHLNLLRVLDPVRYESEVASFPRKKLKDATVTSIISYGDGNWKSGSHALIDSLPGRFVPGPFYEIADRERVERTKDLNTVAATINFVGSPADVKFSAQTLIRAAASRALFSYDRSESMMDRCAFVVGELAQKFRINMRLRTIKWSK